MGLCCVGAQAEPQANATPTEAGSSGWMHWHGDVGLADYSVANWANASGSARKSTVLPYLFGQTDALLPSASVQGASDFSGALFARVDTFGIKTLPIGWGHLELAGRLSFEGQSLPGLVPRRNPLPLGVGTFQETPVGGFFFNAFHDPVSGGQLLDFNYAAEFSWHGVDIYPQLGAQWRSARYVNHLLGVSAPEALRSPWPADSPGAATTPVLALALQMPLSVPMATLGWTAQGHPAWSLLMEWRRKWADATIAQSPLVHSRVLDDGLLALLYSFD